MTPISIETLIKVAHLAQQNGLLTLKDTRIVLEAVEEGERELALSNQLLKLAGAEQGAEQVDDLKVDDLKVEEPTK